MTARGKLIVIGIAGLDLTMLERMIAEGRLPAFAQCLRGGTLFPLPAVATPAAWASLASGVEPAQHGIFLADAPCGGGLRATGRGEWRAPPLWDGLAQAGVATAGLGWPGLVPGAAWAGAHIDARINRAGGLSRDDWPLPPDVSPPALRARLRELRVHPRGVPEALATPLAAGGATVASAQVLLAHLATFQAGADLLREEALWDALIIHCDWLDVAAPGFAPDTLPPAGWALLDRAFAALTASPSPDALLLVASLGLRAPGFLIARGPGFEPGRRAAGVSPLRLAPTAYAHLGFSDARLPPPLQARARLRPIEPAPPPHPSPTNPADVARLNGFGIELAVSDRRWQARRLIAEAEMLVDRDPTRARALAEAALSSDPSSFPALGLLATALVALGEREALGGAAERIAAGWPEHVWADLAHAAVHALDGDLTAARPHLERVARDGDDEERLRAGALYLMLERRAEAAQLFKGVLERQPQHLGALLGLVATGTMRGLEAEALLRRILMLDPQQRAALDALASLLRALGRTHEADKLA